ncbi:hypothetical protein BH23GEM9_BH23GEM9_11730 [soil metagenome]
MSKMHPPSPPVPKDEATPQRRETDSVSDLLFQWETRDFGPLRRIVAAAGRQGSRAVSSLSLGVTVFVLGAAVSVAVGGAVIDTEVESGTVLEQRLLEAENALRAREGELELARLEMNRLAAIIGHSRDHRIPADLASAIYDIALSEGVDPALAFSLVRVESGFVRRAVSSAGAVGLTQVMPSTAFWLQPGIEYNDLFERDTNLRLGFRYLRLMVEQYRGDMHLALLAYNRGPGRVDDILRAGGDPANGYSRLVQIGARRRSE